MPMKGNSSRGTRCQRALIVDDEHFATHLLGRLLRRHGYVAAEENDSTKALQVALRFRPDIILVDVHMPWKDGHELAADLAAHPSLCHVPIVFITADALELDQSSGSIPMLVKPFSIEDLLARLEEGIAGKFEIRQEMDAAIFTESGVG